MADLLEVDERGRKYDTPYRCHDHLLEHKEALFAHLRERWTDLFRARYDVLFYDLTSTYFECDVPMIRPIRGTLVVTPEGLLLAYEMMPGNTVDKTTLRDMLALAQKRHGQAKRVWVTDRSIPTEEILTEMCVSMLPVDYLVGTPKSRLSKLEATLVERP